MKDRNEHKAVAILRISSKRQEENTSHDLQEKEIRSYCQRQGLELASIEAIVESAKDSNLRKKFHAILDSAIAKGIKNLIFYKFDRESRNLRDIEQSEALIRSGTLKIHYVADGKVFDRNTPDSEYLSRDLQAVIAKNYIRDLSSKVCNAMRTKAESGWYPSNHPPLGYVTEKLKNEQGRDLKRGAIIIPDPNTKNVLQVRREFELRAKGLSFDQIREQIISEGFISHSKISEYRKSAIHYRLTNRFYFGFFTWQGVEYRGKHELIISIPLLEAVQATFGQRGQSKRPTGIFSGGWLKCGDPSCGCVIIYDPKVKTIQSTGLKKTFPYYHCTNGKRVHPSLKGLSVTEPKLWEQFGNAVEGITITEELAADIASALNETQEKAREATHREMNSYRSALHEVDQKSDGLFDLFVSKTIDETVYRRQALRLKEERDRYTSLLEHAQIAVTDAALETAKSILELATNAKILWLSKSPEGRRADLDRILSNPVLAGQTVRFNLRKPFSVLAEMRQSEKWWAHLDEFRTACRQCVA